jgi:hypothetical protein
VPIATPTAVLATLGIPLLLTQGGATASFPSRADIGPRYAPQYESLWRDYTRTGCFPVSEAVRRPDGRYAVRTVRRCDRPAWSDARD